MAAIKQIILKYFNSKLFNNFEPSKHHSKTTTRTLILHTLKNIYLVKLSVYHILKLSH
jgi:hypothetical protein